MSTSEERTPWQFIEWTDVAKSRICDDDATTVAAIIMMTIEPRSRYSERAMYIYFLVVLYFIWIFEQSWALAAWTTHSPPSSLSSSSSCDHDLTYTHTQKLSHTHTHLKHIRSTVRFDARSRRDAYTRNVRFCFSHSCIDHFPLVRQDAQNRSNRIFRARAYHSHTYFHFLSYTFH